MSSLVIAAYCLGAPLAFLALVALSGRVGRRLSGSEFSWWRYGAWAFVAIVLAVLVVAARSGGLFFGLAVALVVWVLTRAAVDAQATTLREKVGFVQLYAGLALTLYLALARLEALDGVRAAPWLGYVIHDHLGHLILPLASWLPGGASSAAADVVFGVAETLSSHWLFLATLSTFWLAAFAYAHFAEHATPNIGLSLLPAPTAVSIAFAVVWLAAVVLPDGSAADRAATILGIGMAPFFVAEGLWVAHRLGSGLRARAALTTSLGGSVLLVPSVGTALAVVGWTFHLVKLRAFQPVLGDVERSQSRPSLRSALLVSGAAALACAILGGAEARALAVVSPRLGQSPSACADISLTESASGVVVFGGGANFTIDRDETRVPDATLAGLGGACAARGARLCTSDEWAMACLCSFPNESEGGAKIFANGQMLYRIDSERRPPVGEAAPLGRLLTGGTEIVAPAAPFAGVFTAGPTDAVDDPWTADCRYRGVATRRAIDEKRWPFVSVRCCR